MPLTGEYEPSTSDWARQQAETYTESGGTTGTTLRGMPVIVLTSVGAKSGKLRKTPLMRVEHEGEYAVVASLGGAPKHPVWYYNLVKDPHVELQDGTNTGISLVKSPVRRRPSGGNVPLRPIRITLIIRPKRHVRFRSSC